MVRLTFPLISIRPCSAPSLIPSFHLSSPSPLLLACSGILFVDSPVGTGFSEAGGPDAYSRTVRREGGKEGGRGERRRCWLLTLRTSHPQEEDVAENLYVFLQG